MTNKLTAELAHISIILANLKEAQKQTSDLIEDENIGTAFLNQNFKNFSRLDFLIEDFEQVYDQLGGTVK